MNRQHLSKTSVFRQSIASFAALFAVSVLPMDAADPTRFQGIWDAEPVVFGQEVGAVSDASYASAWSRYKDLGYAPVGLGGVEKSGAPTLWSGLWHKDSSIANWTSKRGMTAAEYQSTWNTLIGQGFRVLDLDAHVVSGVARYNAIWIQEVGGSKPFFSHRVLTLAQLDAKVNEYAALGFRPIKVNGYRVGSQTLYAAVWVDDNETDAALKRDLTSDQYAAWWTFYKNQGYRPVDIAAYATSSGLRYAGIWVREANVDAWISVRDRNTANMLSELLTQKKANYLMTDFDAYYVGNELRFSGVWVRRTARNVLTSNVALSGSAITQLQAKIASYVALGGDNRKGSLGFYIEDLSNGNYIAYNPHEPFYLASAAKTFIASKVVSSPELPLGNLYTLATSDWRGETTRGFTKSDIGDTFPVSEYLDNMIDGSDSASTDKLSGLIASIDDALAVNAHLDDDASMLNVGEITTICQVDKRIQGNADSCVHSVPCHSFESWFRAGDLSYSSAADIACFQKVNASGISTDRRYDLFYHSLANSVTPAEVGRFFRALGEHELHTAFDEGDLVRELDKNNSFQPPANGAFERWGGKDGGKYKVKTWIGLAFDFDFDTGDYSSLTHQFSVAVFTEDWTADDATGDALATAIVGDVIQTAVPYLAAKR